MDVREGNADPRSAGMLSAMPPLAIYATNDQARQRDGQRLLTGPVAGHPSLLPSPPCPFLSLSLSLLALVCSRLVVLVDDHSNDRLHTRRTNDRRSTGLSEGRKSMWDGERAHEMKRHSLLQLLDK